MVEVKDEPVEEVEDVKPINENQALARDENAGLNKDVENIALKNDEEELFDNVR
ncbi:unnamed protein product [Strongylus vulgaris]|uniref:Uncharacterized protein n=1 Tax=Strongylus vulgaris TaxID=40348 RepID=A0A3P7LM22_STRVU|nr:unnamed protein product [Strongylus vulgaris]